MCDLCLKKITPTALSCTGEASTSTTSSSLPANAVQASAALPHFSVQQQASYLTTGFWNARFQTPHSFQIHAGDTLTVDLTGLASGAASVARTALDAWTAVSGINFAVTTAGAKISFVENQSGAWEYSNTSGTTTLSSTINVASSWVQYGAYYLQTFIHEIGHALGLGHAGNYNGQATFATNASYQEDSWQMSIMSYFDQDQNPYASADFAFLTTPMMADIAAIHSLYGTPTNVRTGNDVYGDNRTQLGSGADIPAGFAETISDSGGIDTIDLSLRSANQRLDLQPGSFSDIGGKIGNLAIAVDTMIENATTGSGNDIITGNAAANRLSGNAGNDTIFGAEGNDVLIGGPGNDVLHGDAGIDTAVVSGRLASYTISFLGSGSDVKISGPSGIDFMDGIERIQFDDALVTLSGPATLFDSVYYYQQNPDVLASGVDAYSHYTQFGKAEGRNPNAYFNTTAYLAVNPDVKASGMDPLEHYRLFGSKEGRDTSLNFDTRLYLLHNPDVKASGADALEHYLNFGKAEGRATYTAVGESITADGFDDEYYLFANPDVAKTGVNAHQHYLQSGFKEGRNANFLFDTRYYLEHNPDVAKTGVDPLTHYHLFGFKEGRDPSADFDTSAYLAANPDVAAAGVDPLSQYLHFGIYEGRAIQHADALMA